MGIKFLWATTQLSVLRTFVFCPDMTLELWFNTASQQGVNISLEVIQLYLMNTALAVVSPPLPVHMLKWFLGLLPCHWSEGLDKLEAVMRLQREPPVLVLLFSVLCLLLITQTTYQYSSFNTEGLGVVNEHDSEWYWYQLYHYKKCVIYLLFVLNRFYLYVFKYTLFCFIYFFPP